MCHPAALYEPPLISVVRFCPLMRIAIELFRRSRYVSNVSAPREFDSTRSRQLPS
jgi:hypothetical protein